MSEAEPGAASAVEMATRRLAAALDALQEVIEQRREMDGDPDAATARAQALAADRARLADQLDSTLSRSRALEQANREVAQRLDSAIATVRSVIESGGAR